VNWKESSIQDDSLTLLAFPVLVFEESCLLSQPRVEHKKIEANSMFPDFRMPCIMSMSHSFENSFFNPLYPHSWERLWRIWGASPNRRHPPQADCTSFRGTCSGESCTRPAEATLCPTQGITVLVETPIYNI
jgi:hypothetical protein